MSHLVIAPNGTTSYETTTPTLDRIDAIVGPSGWARVHVHPDRRMAGWVGDCILIDGSPRNLVGSCVLAALGASRQPYAGPVVVTGYDHSSDWGGPEPLLSLQVKALKEIVTAVQAALGDHHETATPPPGADRSWIDAIREYADLVRTSETPKIRIITDEKVTTHD